jgi:hypothetical protein
MGVVHYHQGGFKGTMRTGDQIQYNKHGLFHVEYVGGSYGIIHHVTPRGEVHKIFIPEKKRVTISRGQWLIEDVYHYDQWEEYYLKQGQAA